MAARVRPAVCRPARPAGRGPATAQAGSGAPEPCHTAAPSPSGRSAAARRRRLPSKHSRSGSACGALQAFRIRAGLPVAALRGCPALQEAR